MNTLFQYAVFDIIAAAFLLSALLVLCETLGRITYWFTMALWYVIRRVGHWYLKPFIRDGPNKKPDA